MFETMQDRRWLILLIIIVALLAMSFAFLLNTDFPQDLLAPNNLSQSAFLDEDTPQTNVAAVSPEKQATGQEIGKWKRFEVVYNNDSWSDNPFDLEFSGVFTHVPSGRKVTQLGFYAGNNIWKLYFMPDELGEWTFTTTSPDPDLDGKTGSFSCVPSDLPGPLVAKDDRWMLKDSGRVISPIMLATREWFKRTDTDEGIDDFIQWSRNTAGATIIGTTLVYFTQDQSEIPYVKGLEGIEFNIPMWDRLNSHFDMLRDQGMGFYIMFYSDDEESPNIHNITPRSPEEMRLFRYAIARLSSYPIVMWDTGIDIGETRSDEWIDWFATWFTENDPWQHAVSSRTGGGSFGKFPATANYYSDGAADLPDRATMVEDWRSRQVPTAYTDRWREYYVRSDFDANKIRTAAWQVALSGGSAVYFGGNDYDGYLGESYAQDLEAAPQLGYRTRFLKEQIADQSRLSPHDELLTSGSGAMLSANPGVEYLVYDVNGGTIGIDLTNDPGSFGALWLNPRTGDVIPFDEIGGGDQVSITTPDDGDWVLYLQKMLNRKKICANSFLSASAVSATLKSISRGELTGFLTFLPLTVRC
jgi:hypothetical protein